MREPTVNDRAPVRACRGRQSLNIFIFFEIVCFVCALRVVFFESENESERGCAIHIDEPSGGHRSLEMSRSVLSAPADRVTVRMPAQSADDQRLIPFLVLTTQLADIATELE